MRSVYTDEYAAVLKCLVAARKRARLTQQELAARLAKPQSFISKYENGERRIDVAEFLYIARVIGADPHVLINDILHAAPKLRVRYRKRPGA
jgi:transcriptional regulator with XRE-family HTH domain